MGDLLFSQEGPSKLWVETPRPVTHNVWDYFALTAFSGFDGLSRKGAGPEHRYLNRNPGNEDYGPRGEIADGQYGFYWRTHAYLPDDGRAGLAKDTTGVIIVPEDQSHYIGQLQDALAYRRHHSDVIRHLEEIEDLTINGAFLVLKRAVADPTERAEVIYSRTLGGTAGQIGFPLSEIAPDNSNPLRGANNTLRNQTGLDFLRTLKEICGAEPVDGVWDAMYERYQDFHH